MQRKRWLGWLIFGLGLVMAVRTGRNLHRIWRTGDVLKQARQELAELNAENERLKLRLDEVQTPEWQEAEIKEKLGYGKEGETILILPKETSSQGPVLSTQGPEIPNWKKWWKLYVSR